MRVRGEGGQVLRVEADGAWTLELKQPLAFGGRGAGVSPFFDPVGQLRTFRLTHGGREAFVVWLVDGSGRRVDRLVDETGPYDGAVAFGPPEDLHLLEVEADGDWSARVD
jgi:hypothetical protein